VPVNALNISVALAPWSAAAGSDKPSSPGGNAAPPYQPVARGEWKPGGSHMAVADTYNTSKQALLAATLGIAREALAKLACYGPVLRR